MSKAGRIFILSAVCLAVPAPAAAVSFLPPAAESQAYKDFTNRPPSDFSKLLYLIDRFGSSHIEIYYDGYYYKAKAASLIAKAFLVVHYKKETVPEWLLRWCNTSVGGEIIYVKLPDGSFRRAHEVLTEEWEMLEKRHAAL